MSVRFPIDYVIEALRDAWLVARPIVPIVGAGLSADSGFPILNSVVRYFAKFHEYLDTSAFLPNKQAPLKRLQEWANNCKRMPWKYVEDFDWPDWFDLNQDLLYRLEENRTISGKICTFRDSIVPKTPVT